MPRCPRPTRPRPGQLDVLHAAWFHEVFIDHASGTPTDRRPQPAARPVAAGATLVGWRLDHLGRSTAHPIDTATGLGERGVGFCPPPRTWTPPPGRSLAVRDHGRPRRLERDLVVERTDAARRLLAGGQSKTAVAATLGVSRRTRYGHLTRDGPVHGGSDTQGVMS